MTWTILALIIAVALYMFGTEYIKLDPKKSKVMHNIVHKSVHLVAIALLIVGVARIWTPVYLTSVNPGIVMEMVKGAQAAEQNKSSGEIKKYVKKNMDRMMENAPIMGNEAGSKTIFFFTDMLCPYCARAHSELARVVEDNSDVRVVIKNMPLPMHGEEAVMAARATIAAKIQSNAKAIALDEALMKDFAKWAVKNDLKASTKNVMDLAKKAGLDTERLEKDMKGDVVRNELAQVSELAQRFGIQGTPFLIVGDQAFPGAVPAAQIKQALR
ncbi:MAG: thioredoxin domain-containing protein [Alphaproteobacteria bacterium]|nr:thioredoxin domain-containing protein [Alphaproteobacteria bacterium]